MPRTGQAECTSVTDDKQTDHTTEKCSKNKQNHLRKSDSVSETKLKNTPTCNRAQTGQKRFLNCSH